MLEIFAHVVQNETPGVHGDFARRFPAGLDQILQYVRQKFRYIRCFALFDVWSAQHEEFRAENLAAHNTVRVDLKRPMEKFKN